ncbi:hypothetical protein UZ35_07985 [Heyndrickxia coagulans]|uniref:Uncharacterized protein n=1 Tax=Heyndrickxia coagulans TaxID=1398 RepID=A0AAN0T5P0_HEYCO|nr:hypothetical protein SB48_HM08orf02711 [Heyndrickxia coagulans]APB36518.1 hypothetical protein BIZ35_06510 [Heyndrickxia coagulans]ATW82815.1 hypothetical protein CIW84_07465 [Heyndrickxia coagulans]KGB28586.1 hypothetical protein IE89_15480 [Heyndrickxia coagulans]KXT20794.1 hypothetical protein UZ35_07985 [Heyndrickxia coagulans]
MQNVYKNIHSNGECRNLSKSFVLLKGQKKDCAVAAFFLLPVQKENPGKRRIYEVNRLLPSGFCMLDPASCAGHAY